MNPLAGLGRIPSKPDSRDYNHAMPRRSTSRMFRHWTKAGPALDQYDTPHCVAFSGVHYLTASPVINAPVDTTALYADCQRHDEWEGEAYAGTSVRALFKVLKGRGYITSYVWAWDAATVAQHVLEVGPVVVGTNWHMDMAMPTSAGYITPTGPIFGGHAYTILGVNLNRRNPDKTLGAFRILNSWGDRFGAEGGRAWVSITDIDFLIRADGEACAAVEKRLVA